MIEPVSWDSRFFSRKIGRVSVCPSSLEGLTAALDAAKSEGFQSLMRRIGHDEFDSVQMFERAGFCLVDAGIVWTCSAQHRIQTEGADPTRQATVADIPALQQSMRRLWTDSRFYHDPFFSTEEADRLFDAWVQNSVTGQAADAAFTVDNLALVTCKKVDGNRGDIPLVGVHPSQQGKGYGRWLVARALQWFSDNGCRTVTVRTQLRNVDALNFYRSLGFVVGGADMTVSKIL